jgi:hypothetical protein
MLLATAHWSRRGTARRGAQRKTALRCMKRRRLLWTRSTIRVSIAARRRRRARARARGGSGGRSAGAGSRGGSFESDV